MEFYVGNAKCRISDIYSATTWKHDFVWVDVWKDDHWVQYKFLEVNKIYKYLTNDK